MFFKRIFRKPKPPEVPKVERLSLEALGERVNALKERKLTEGHRELSTIFDEMAKEREQLRTGLKALAEAEPTEEVHLGLQKTVIEARRLFIDKMNRASAGMMSPKSASIEELKASDDSLTRSVSLLMDAASAHGRYVRMLFNPQLRPLELRLRRLHSLATQAHSLTQKTLEEVNSLDSLLSKIADQKEFLRREKTLQSNIQSLEKRVSELEHFIEARKSELNRLVESEEFKCLKGSQRDLQRLEREIADVERAATSAISSFSRPLRKMEKLVSAGGYPLDREKVRTLELCIEDPLKAFLSKDQALITALLQDMLEVIERDKIALDARDKRKHTQKARELIEGKTLARLGQTLERLRDEREALERVCQQSTLLRQKEGLERSIHEHESELNHARATLEVARRDIQGIKEGIAKGKHELEKISSGVLGAEVTIILS